MFCPDEVHVLEISFSLYMKSVFLKMDSLLNWNVRGLSRKRIENFDFLNLVNKFDVCCLLEYLGLTKNLQ